MSNAGHQHGQPGKDVGECCILCDRMRPITYIGKGAVATRPSELAVAVANVALLRLPICIVLVMAVPKAFDVMKGVEIRQHSILALLSSPVTMAGTCRNFSTNGGDAGDGGVERLVGRETGIETGREVEGAETGRDVGKVTGTEVGREVGRLVGREIGIDEASEMGSEVGIEIGSEVGREIGKEVGREAGTAEEDEVGAEGSAVGREVGRGKVGRDICARANAAAARMRNTEIVCMLLY